MPDVPLENCHTGRIWHGLIAYCHALRNPSSFRNFYMKQTFRLRLCCALCAFSALAVTGCSTTAPSPVASANATTAVAPATSPLVIGYAEGQEQALTDLKLKPTFEAYWRTHAAKNWSQLFSMEHAERLPSVGFYTAYHAKAWPLLEIQVLEASLEEQQATLTLRVRLQNPDKKGREHAMHRKDQWQRTEDGRWLHIVTDPMLAGIKQ